MKKLGKFNKKVFLTERSSKGSIIHHVNFIGIKKRRILCTVYLKNINVPASKIHLK
jgi:hypothetical protein